MNRVYGKSKQKFPYWEIIISSFFAHELRYDRQSSHPGEFHPKVLTEPYVKVSLHTALPVQSQDKHSVVMSTYGRTNFQCANKLGWSAYLVCNHFTEAFL